MEEFKIQQADKAEVFQITLDPIKTPVAYSNRVDSLMSSGLSQVEAEREALLPMDMEIFYDPAMGCFTVESEAIDCTNIYNPYTGGKLEVENE